MKGATFLNRVIKYQTFISIHAPVKGATANQGGVPYVYFDFNPRPREGSDSISSALEMKID